MAVKYSSNSINLDEYWVSTFRQVSLRPRIHTSDKIHFDTINGDKIARIGDKVQTILSPVCTDPVTEQKVHEY